MISLETAQNIQKISFVFFIILTLTHLLSGLAVTQGYFPEQSPSINKLLLIPSVLSALSYAFSSLKANMCRWGVKSEIWDYLIIGFGIFIFVALIAAEFFFPDK